MKDLILLLKGLLACLFRLGIDLLRLRIDACC